MESVKSLLKEMAKDKKYISTNQAKQNLQKKSEKFKDKTIKKYFFNLKKSGDLYDAGRGWYSTIEQKFELYKSPVSSLVEEMEQDFPDLTFCVWSTEQISDYYHHLPTKFVTFIYAKKKFLSSLMDYFRGGDQRVFNNPDQKEIEKNFFIEESPIILRPQISQEPRDGHYAAIQKILVDLWVEQEQLPVLDEAEYQRIFKNLVMEFRIKVAKLLRYAGRRSCKEEIKNLLVTN